MVALKISLGVLGDYVKVIHYLRFYLYCDGSFKSAIRWGCSSWLYLQIHCGSQISYPRNGDSSPFCKQYPNFLWCFTYLDWQIEGHFSVIEAVSGLHINLAKSKLVLVGDVLNVGELVAILGCRQSSLTMTYLGLSLGAKFKDRAIWNPILEEMERRLAS